MTPITSTALIVVIDDNEDDAVLLRERLSEIEWLNAQIVHVENAQNAVEVVRRTNPAVIFLDYKLGATTGLDLLRRFRTENLLHPVIMLTGAGDEYLAAETAHAGAYAYLIKDDMNTPRLPETLRRVLDQADADAPRRAEQASTLARLETLTPREREVLGELVAGLTNKQIGIKLHRSVETIKVHRAHIMSKLQADSTADLVRRVMNAKLG